MPPSRYVIISLAVVQKQCYIPGYPQLSLALVDVAIDLSHLRL